MKLWGSISAVLGNFISEGYNIGERIPTFHSPSRSCISFNKIHGFNAFSWSSGFRATGYFHLIDQKEKECTSKHPKRIILGMWQSFKRYFLKPVCNSLQNVYSNQCNIFILWILISLLDDKSIFVFGNNEFTIENVLTRCTFFRIHRAESFWCWFFFPVVFRKVWFCCHWNRDYLSNSVGAGSWIFQCHIAQQLIMREKSYGYHV